MKLLQGRVAVVTGAGNGIGRGEAIALATHGARVLVNDLGVGVDGTGEDTRPADVVVELIRTAGGHAVADYEDISDWNGARRVVEHAIDEFGQLDVLVNNAGFQRPGDLFETTEDDWDATVRVHMKGTFGMMRHAASRWRAEALARRARSASIINTTSPAGLPGDPGMPAYAASKAGVAALTVGASLELAPYGVRVNAIAPFGLTRLVENLLPGDVDGRRAPSGPFDPANPDNNAPLVVWLASDAARHVTGQIFRTRGGDVIHYEPWQPGARVSHAERWDPLSVGAAIDTNVFRCRAARRAPEPEIRALLEPTRS